MCEAQILRAIFAVDPLPLILRHVTNTFRYRIYSVYEENSQTELLDNENSLQAAIDQSEPRRYFQ